MGIIAFQVAPPTSNLGGVEGAFSTGVQAGDVLTSGAPSALLNNYLPEDSPIKDILGSYDTVKQALDSAAVAGMYLPDALAAELAQSGVGLYGAPGTWAGAGPAQTGSVLGNAAPVIGGALAGYAAYQQTGEAGDAITAAFFTGVGTALGGPLGGLAGSIFAGMVMSSPTTVSIPENAQMKFTTPLGQIGLDMAGFGTIDPGGSPHKFTVDELTTAMERINGIQVFDSAVDSAFKQLAQSDPNFDEEYSRAVVRTQQSGTKYNLKKNTESEYGASMQQRWDDYTRMIPALKSLVDEKGLDMDSFTKAYGPSKYNIPPGLNEVQWEDLEGKPLYNNTEGVYTDNTPANNEGILWYTPQQEILEGSDFANIPIDPNDMQSYALLKSNPDVATALNEAPNGPPSLTYTEILYFTDHPEQIQMFFG